MRILFIVLSLILIGSWMSSAKAEMHPFKIGKGYIQILNGQAPSNLFKTPSGMVCSYSKDVCHDVTRFYKKERIDLNLSFRYIREIGSNGLLTFNNTIYTGYDSLKYDVEPTLWVGINYKRIVSDSFSFSLTLSPTIVIGGGVRETSCTDSLDRDYYCGDLTAWSDYTPVDDLKSNTSVGILFKWKF